MNTGAPQRTSPLIVSNFCIAAHGLTWYTSLVSLACVFCKSVAHIRLSLAENPIIPDIAVYNRELRYTESSPIVTPLVVIEVGLSMTQHDHTIKGPRYARAGIQELWLITMPELSRYPVTTGYLLDPEH